MELGKEQIYAKREAHLCAERLLKISESVLVFCNYLKQAARYSYRGDAANISSDNN